MENYRLLIIDDDPDLSKNIKDILVNNGYAVNIANSGKEAIEICKKEKFHLALVDIKLPDYAGIDLIYELDKFEPSLEYIVITGFATKDTAKKAAGHHNIISYEEKPLDFEHLIYIIEQTKKRQSAEIALKKSEKNYRELFNNALVGITVHGPKGKILEANPKSEEIFGFSESELKEKSVNFWKGKLFSSKKEVLDNSEFPISVVAENKEPQDGFVIGLKIPEDSELRWFLQNTRPILSSENKLEKIVAAFVEITKRKKYRETLRFQSMLLDQIGDLITATDLNGRIIYVNQAEADTFGVPKDALIGKRIYSYGEDEKKGATQDEIYEATIKHGEWKGEVVNYSIDGQEHILDCRTQKVKNELGEEIALCSVSTDITERKRREERIEQLNTLLRSISLINQLIVQEDNIDKMMQGACDTIVDTGPYLGCSISLYHENTEKISPDYKSGLHLFEQDWTVTREGEGLAPPCIKKVLTSSRIQINYTKNCHNCKYKKNEQEQICIAAPMKLKNEIMGILQVGKPKNSVIKKEEKSLLDEVSSDLIFAHEKIKTEHKQEIAQESLKESNRQIRAMFEDPETFMGIIGLDGTLLVANKSSLKFINADLPELKGKKFWNTPWWNHSKELQSRLKKEIERASKGENIKFEAKHLGYDDKEIFVEFSLRPVKDAEGNIYSLLAEGVNITKRKQGEQVQEVLHTIANATNTSKNLQELYETIRNELGKIMDTTNFYIASYDEKTKKISVPYFADKLTKKAPQKQELKKRSLTEYVIRTKKPLYLTKNKRKKLIEKGEIAQNDWKSKLWLGVPLKTKNEVIGALAVQSYTNPDLYCKKDLKILEFASDEIAMAIKRKSSEEDLKLAFESTIDVITDILEVRDAYTAGHQRRVSQLAVEIADEMGIKDNMRKGLEVASNIHDLGKIIVPAQILSKPTELSDLEFSYIMQHPVVGHELLKKVDFPWPIADIVYQHHERLDGSGYPQGLQEDEIMLEAQILAVADVVEAMSSQRPYRPALGVKAALAEVNKHKGTKYNKQVVEACVKVMNSDFKFVEIERTVLASNK